MNTARKFAVVGTTTVRSIKPKTKTKNRKVNKRCQHLSYVSGSVCIAVLGLSVAHCTESITLLTGSYWFLAALLAVGIDAGMVASELAELLSHGCKGAEDVKRWARGYTWGAVAISVILNAYAFGQHAPNGMVWAAWLLGSAIPFLVYALGRVAGYLWQLS